MLGPVAVLAAAIALGAGWWWFRGGTVLDVGGGTAIAAARPGVTTNVGLSARTDGGTVTLEGFDAPRTPGLHLRVVVVRAQDHRVGLTYGPLPETHPLRGYRVGPTDPVRPTFQLVLRATADRPGTYALGGVRIHYRSGPRHRTAVTDAEVACPVLPGPIPVPTGPSGWIDPCAAR